MEQIKKWSSSQNRDRVVSIFHEGVLFKKVTTADYNVALKGYGLSTYEMLRVKGKCKTVRIAQSNAIREIPFSKWVSDGVRRNFGQGSTFYYPWAKMKVKK